MRVLLSLLLLLPAVHALTEPPPSDSTMAIFLVASFMATLVESSSGFGSGIVYWLFYQVYSFVPGSQVGLVGSLSEIIVTGQTIVGILVILESRAWRHMHKPSVATCGFLTMVVAPIGQRLVVVLPVWILKILGCLGLLGYFAWRAAVRRLKEIGEVRSGRDWTERRMGEAGRERVGSSVVDMEMLAIGLGDVESAKIADMYDRVAVEGRTNMWWKIAAEEGYAKDEAKRAYEDGEERVVVRRINNRFLKEARGSGHTKKENLMGVSEKEIARSNALKKLGGSEKVFQMSKAMKAMGVAEVPQDVFNDERLSTTDLPAVVPKHPSSKTWKQLMPWMVIAGVGSGVCGGVLGIWGPPIIIWFHHLASVGVANKQCVRTSGVTIGFLNVFGRWFGILLFPGATAETAVGWELHLQVAAASLVGTILGFVVQKNMDVTKIKGALDAILLLCALSLGIGGLTSS